MEHKKFITAMQNPDAGLNNSTCTKKDYFCNYHKVYMSKADVEKKGCLRRQTFDMLSTRRCNYCLNPDQVPLGF